MTAGPELRCGFCGKKPAELNKLIRSVGLSWIEPPMPEVSICNECVELCMDVCARGNPEWRDRQIERLRQMLP
jgi:hypothetical protein